jgi:hypothetical protein
VENDDRLARIETTLDAIRHELSAGNERATHTGPVASVTDATQTPKESEPIAASAGGLQTQLRSSENHQAQISASAVLDNAISAGRWTDFDRDQLREHFGALASEDKMALMEKLAEAVNSGQLSLNDLNGPPIY